MTDSKSMSPDSGASHSKLACERCKRRKIKCDRSFPSCRTCYGSSRECVYPLTANKPGPKPGAPQRRRTRLAQGQRATQIQSSNDLDIPKVDLSPSKVRPIENSSGIPSPISSIVVATPETETPSSSSLALSQLLHLSHDLAPSNTHNTDSETVSEPRYDVIVSKFCDAFSITTEDYLFLYTAYFNHITAFSLFHRPTFHNKLATISSPLHVNALLASIFAFSARYKGSSNLQSGSSNTSSERFAKSAELLTDQALRECSDDIPPLCLLQALILVSFRQLIDGVRGRAWRSHGMCVRIAYELQLHLIDKNSQIPNPGGANLHLDEEKRRAWWTIWEFDVYASTVRRLPTGIDWKNNETFLPISDELWYADKTAKSCKLDRDPAVAWKSLRESGNTSPKAWFIVINALMRCAQLYSYPQAYSISSAGKTKNGNECIEHLSIIANSLYCISSALPESLMYKGEYLPFNTEDRISFQLDSAKHSICIMLQLARFMIYHHQVFSSTSRLLAQLSISPSGAIKPELPAADHAAWNHYLSAATEIVNLVRNCSPVHVKYVNPFLANTIWLAAAAQVVSKVLAPIPVDRRTAESNLDVLQANLNAYIAFCGGAVSQKQKLSTLEMRLNNSKEQAASYERQHSTSHQQSGNVSPISVIRQANDTSNTEIDKVAVANDHSVEVSTSIEQSPSPINWVDQHGFDFQWATSGQEVNSDIWGWFTDELLAYPGM
ncbi:fungal-specific transcription factor domain-containing protein [Xylogone sp. PMI_703]|nr:fungal-specific transcription factor domain-containing protein [Xylogone sp. PMI_703]